MSKDLYKETRVPNAFPAGGGDTAQTIASPVLEVTKPESLDGAKYTQTVQAHVVLSDRREAEVYSAALAGLRKHLELAAIDLARSVFWEHPADTCDKASRVTITMELKPWC